MHLSPSFRRLPAIRGVPWLVVTSSQSLPSSSTAFSPGVRLSPNFPFQKDSGRIQLGPTLMTSFEPLPL